MEKVRRIHIPTFEDPRGKLSVIELRDFIDWIPKRVYYVTDVKQDRGGHAVRGEKKIYVCMEGSVTASIHDGEQWQEFEMKGPMDALVMNGMCWRDFKNFMPGTVLMAVSNMNYEKDQYIFDFDEFLKISASV